jgi:ribosomal protein S18 acetylase RimI-like enzyme
MKFASNEIWGYVNLQPSPSVILEKCNKNLVRTMEWVASVSPNGAVETHGKIALIKTAIPSSEFNIAFALDRPTSIDGVSESIMKLFQNPKIAWELFTVSSVVDALLPVISEFDLEKKAVEPGMVLSPLPDDHPSLPIGLEIRRISELQELQTFLKIGMIGFGDPSGTLLNVLASGLSNEKSSLRPACYLGYFNGVPAGTSIRFPFEGIAGIYFVSTLPDFRRRGIGEAMTWQAAIDGKEEGCTASCLQASEIGRPIYEKMGYKKIVDYEVWKPKGQTE